MRHLFQIWLKGAAASNAEITAGLRNARRAYNIAVAQIVRREQDAVAREHTGPQP